MPYSEDEAENAERPFLMSQERLHTNPEILHFELKRNKFFPNSRLPIIVYKSVLNLPKQKNKSATIAQQIFLRNDWGNSWRNGIYNFHHYHSNTHEGMAICMGNVTVILGGPSGMKMKLEAGDVLILPAGTGHKCLSSSEDFLCVGAYPESKDYDMNRGTEEEFAKALQNISHVAIPKHDPVFGKEGFLKMYWK